MNNDTEKIVTVDSNIAIAQETINNIQTLASRAVRGEVRAVNALDSIAHALRETLDNLAEWIKEGEQTDVYIS